MKVLTYCIIILFYSFPPLPFFRFSFPPSSVFRKPFICSGYWPFSIVYNFIAILVYYCYIFCFARLNKNSYDFIHNFNLNPIDCIYFIMLKSTALLCNGDPAVSVRLFLPFDRIISFSLFYENFRWTNRVQLLTVRKCRKINGSRIYPRKRLKTALQALVVQRLYLYDPLPRRLLDTILQEMGLLCLQFMYIKSFLSLQVVQLLHYYIYARAWDSFFLPCWLFYIWKVQMEEYGEPYLLENIV